MADQEREKLVIQIDVDQAAANRARQAIASVRADEQKLAEDFRKLGPIADTGVDLIEGKFELLAAQVDLARAEMYSFGATIEDVGTVGSSWLSQLSDGIDFTTSEIERLRAEVLGTSNAINNMPSDVRVNIGRVGSTGTQILGGLGQSEAANAVGLVSDALDALTTQTPGMLALTAAGGAAALVVDQVTQAYQRQIEAGREAAEAAAGFADDVVAGLTSADVQGEIAKLQTAFFTTLDFSNAAVRLQDALMASFDRENNLDLFDDEGRRREREEQARIYRELSSLTGVDITDLTGVNEFVRGLEQQLFDLADGVEERQAQLASGVLTVNDLAVAADAALMGATAGAAAARAAAEASIAAVDAQTERNGQLAIQEEQLRRSIDSMTQEQRDARQRAIEMELMSLSELASNGALTAAQFQAVNTEIEALSMELGLLRDTTYTTADATERLRVAQELYDTVTDDYFKAVSDQVDAAAEYQKALTEYNAALAESAAKIAELRADATQDIAKIEATAAKDRTEAARDLAEKLAKIDGTYTKSATQARLDRDELAAKQAEATRKDETDAANDAYNKQIQVVKDRLDEQIATVLQRLGEQVRNAQRAADNEVSAKKRALDQADANQRNANNIMLALQQQYQNNEYTIRAQAYNALANQAYAAGYVTVSQYTAGVNAALAAYAGGGGSGSGYGGGGGRVAPTPLSAMMRDGSPVATSNVNLTVHALSGQLVDRRVDSRVAQMLDDAGLTSRTMTRT